MKRIKILLLCLLLVFTVLPSTVYAGEAGTQTVYAKKTKVNKYAEPGLYKVDGKWRYLENGTVVKVTGVVPRVSDGKWFYVKNGKLKKATGVATRLSDGMPVYVKKGRFKKVTGVAKSLEDGGLYYVENGVFASVTGLVKRVGSSRRYYVRDGVWEKFTGLVPRLSDGKMFYVKNGRLDRSYNGKYTDENGRVYKVKNGVGRPKQVISPLATTAHISKNYRERGNFTVKYVIIHHMAGRLTGENCALYFVDNDAGTSANYCIGFDGDISCSVPEGYGGVTSGNPDADKQAITIEVSDRANDDWRIPKKAQAALVELLADIAERYPSFNGKLIYDTEDAERIELIKEGEADWDSTEGNIFLHKWVSFLPRSCPEWHMIKILPSLVRKANKLLK